MSRILLEDTGAQQHLKSRSSVKRHGSMMQTTGGRVVQVDGVMKEDVRGRWSRIEVWGQIMDHLKYQLT